MHRHIRPVKNVMIQKQHSLNKNRYPLEKCSSYSKKRYPISIRLKNFERTMKYLQTFLFYLYRSYKGPSMTLPSPLYAVRTHRLEPLSPCMHVRNIGTNFSFQDKIAKTPCFSSN